MLYELKNVVRKFGDRTVLDISSLSLTARKIYALIGPNGAGKTTLLNQLAFLDRPSGGDIAFRGAQVRSDRDELTRLRRQVVLVDQTPILFTGSVWNNIEFGLKVRGLPRKDRGVKIEAALERVGMSAFARADVHGLSGGEVKRVALARALAVEPDVLLCDEPTANVDREHQEIILKILQHANHTKNTTVIFSTHYLSQSRRVAHRTIVLQNGQLAEDLGENTVSGRIEAAGPGERWFRFGSDSRLMLPPSGQPERASGPALVRLDPERLLLDPAAPDARSPGTVGGIVTSISVEQYFIRVVVDIGVHLQVLMPPGRYQESPPHAGQQVRVVIPDEAVVLLP